MTANEARGLTQAALSDKERREKAEAHRKALELDSAREQFKTAWEPDAEEAIASACQRGFSTASMYISEDIGFKSSVVTRWCTDRGFTVTFGQAMFIDGSHSDDYFVPYWRQSFVISWEKSFEASRPATVPA
jgi:hypothetical protein